MTTRTTATPGPGCRAMLGKVSAYLDGELGTRDCHAIERHCRTCPRCKRVLASLREAVGLCRRAGARPLPPGVRRRARARLKALLKAGPAY